MLRPMLASRAGKLYTGTMMFHGDSRLLADTSITVDMLEADLELWLEHCTTRDILAVLNYARHHCKADAAPGAAAAGILSIGKLLFICLRRCPNGVLPRLVFSQALVNIHRRNPIYFGKRPIVSVAGEIVGITRCALSKVRRRTLIDTGAHAYFTCT